MIPQVPDEAWQLLQDWLPDNDDPERPVMTLATVDESGLPRRPIGAAQRVRPRRLLPPHRRELAQGRASSTRDPASLSCCAGRDALRQLVVRGVAERADRAETDRAYDRPVPLPATARLGEHRPRSRSSRPTSGEPSGPTSATIHPVLDPPESWVGFLVRPTSLTFWTGDPDSVSHRREYRLGASGWSRTELPG